MGLLCGKVKFFKKNATLFNSAFSNICRTPSIIKITGKPKEEVKS